ncbi:centrosomal protein of 162 kDa [Aulostomus maculatus]
MAHRLSKEELDEQFERFLKESVSDDSVDLGGTKSNQQSAQKPTVSWWEHDDHSSGGTGLLGSKKIYRKSLRTSQPIGEENHDPQAKGLTEVATVPSGDISETDALKMTSSMGLNTLEEEEEKSRFFAQLEADASSTINYSLLNRELNSTSSSIGTNLRKAEQEVDQSDNDQRKARDSPGHSYLESGGSQMEALHEAYKQAHVVEDTEDHNSFCSSREGKASIGTPVSATSHLPHATQSLQPASTNESELPTAEELMRPIRPEDHIRGFSLQAVSAVDLYKERTSWPSEGSLLVTTSPEPHLKQLDADSAGFMGDSALESQCLGQDPMWSITEEVERLMQDQDIQSSPYTSSRAKKQAVSQGSAISPSSSIKKSSGEGVGARKVKARPGMASRHTRPQRTVPPGKSQPSIPCSPKPSLKSTKNKNRDDWKHKVTALQQQKHTSSCQDATESQDVQEPQETTLTQQTNKHEAICLFEEMKVQLAQKERELGTIKKAAEELKKENYILQSKLRSVEEASQRRLGETADPATKEKLQQNDKEIKEQELLIKGYQQENEKLYFQMKDQQAQSKANEEAMFNENQRLLNELANTREQLSKSSRPVCSLDHPQQIAELLARINIFQRNETKLFEDIHRLKQVNQSLETEMELVKQDRDLAKAQAITSSDGTFHTHVEDEQRKEVRALKEKLQWFAENKKLHDRDIDRLRAATVETQKLKDKVRNLEQLLRRRNPNSCRYAAAGDQGDMTAKRTSLPSGINTLLERRIQRLEAELENQDEQAKHSLQSMEQEFHRIKLRYEQQISELEKHLEKKEQVVATEVGMSHVHRLEEELKHLKEAQQQKEKSLQDQIETLQQQLKQTAQPSPGRHQQQAKEAVGVRIKHLNQDLATKTQTIQELSRTVEKLQKERRNMLQLPRQEAHSSATRQQQAPSKMLCAATAGEERFPSAHDEKSYQPTVFTGSHISEVLQEKEALMERFRLLEIHSEQEKEALKSDAVEAKREVCRLKEQLSSLKADHLRQLDRLHTTHALQHSSSEVARLASELKTQELMVKHLQEQLKELQATKEALAVSRTREDALQTQLIRLLKELKDAKEAQSPEAKRLYSLDRKIVSMELHLQQRETVLQQVIEGLLPVAEPQSDVDQWKHLAQDKSRELEAFRVELDSILDILRHLQGQGVVLHTPVPFPVTDPHTQSVTRLHEHI